MEELEQRVADLEFAVLELARAEFGDTPGHDFRGNQYTSHGTGRPDDPSKTHGTSPVPAGWSVKKEDTFGRQQGFRTYQHGTSGVKVGYAPMTGWLVMDKNGSTLESVRTSGLPTHRSDGSKIEGRMTPEETAFKAAEKYTTGYKGEPEATPPDPKGVAAYEKVIREASDPEFADNLKTLREKYSSIPQDFEDVTKSWVDKGWSAAQMANRAAEMVQDLSADAFEFGDTEGHPFHGNQWTQGSGTKAMQDAESSHPGYQAAINPEDRRAAPVLAGPRGSRLPDTELTKARDTETRHLREGVARGLSEEQAVEYAKARAAGHTQEQAGEVAIGLRDRGDKSMNSSELNRASPFKNGPYDRGS